MPLRRSILLVAAFAALLAICGGTAWAVWRNTQQAQSNAARLYERDLEIHEALAGLRSSVYLNAILTRDALLEASPNIQDYQQQFRELEGARSRSLEILRHTGGQHLEPVLGKLTEQLGAYADATKELLNWIPGRTQEEREQALRRRVSRRREILILAEETETLAIKSSTEEREQITAANASFRASLGWITGIALLLGASVASLTVFRMRTLEVLSEAAESKLRSLSAQLRTAQEDERKHLARELHDQVGQMLTGLRMELAAISRSEVAVSPKVSAALERAKGNTEQTLNVVRNIAMLLRPSMLDDLGLTPALQWLAKEMERSSGIEVRRTIDSGVDHLPDAHRTCLFRVVQEALTNASRHSGARSVELRVTKGSGWVQVSITDDGRGFDPVSNKRKGLGLLGMEERVRELGGQLLVSSIPGRGASVEIRLPEPVMFEGVITHVNDDSNNDNHDRGRSRDRAHGVEASS